MRYGVPKVRETKSIELSAFRGIDLSNPPSKVKPYRAAYMKNLWNVNGINRKRPGIKQFANVSGKIGGMFKFTLSSREFFVIYAGGKFYDCQRFDDPELGETYHFELLSETAYSGAYAYCAICGDKAYFYGMGDYAVLYYTFKNGWKLEKVAGNNAYIPTTTINIGPDDKTGDKKAVAESPNLLSSFRKNRLTGTDMYDGEELPSLEELNGNISETAPKAKWTLDTAVANLKSVEIEYSATKKISLTCSFLADGNIYVFYNTIKVGYIEQGGKELYLCFKTAPEEKGTANAEESNITVTIATDVGITVERRCIEECTCGGMYGLNGQSNRLSVACENIRKNVVFYSGRRFDTGDADLSYFPDDNTIALASAGAAVKGFCITGDGRLLALKDRNNAEPTAFYIDGEVDSRFDSSGNIVYYREIFKATGGTIGEEPVSQRSVANLAGDLLMLSKNGVFGIVNPQNVYSSGEKSVRLRSRFINADMLKNDLRNAVAVVYDNRYFLAAGNKIYVADARFKSAVEAGDMADTFNYEWWVWEDIPHFSAMAVIDDRLIFGTSDGGLYRLSDDFYDRSYQILSYGEGDFTSERVGGSSQFTRFALAPDYSPKVGDYFVFTKSIENSATEQMRGKELYIVAVYENENGISVELSDEEGGEVMAFKSFDNTAQAKLFKKTAVVSEWITPVFDMGSISKKKVLKAITVSAEKQKNAKLQVGYLTRNATRDLNFKEFESKGIVHFDWNFGVSDAYDNRFDSSYTKAVRDYFNFISFVFRADSACDMAVNALEVKYKIISDNVGVY